MNKAMAFENLKLAFSTFTKAQKENVLYHLKKGTPILCGEAATLYTNGIGGG
jgi:hypothetical protein